MARTIRHIIPDLPHHAIQRGNNRQDIFFDKADRAYFLSKLKKLLEKEKVLIGSYCLMTNHIHMLLYPQERDALITVMKGVAQYYAQYVNHKYKRSGKLWENRYKLHIVDPEYEWVVARYIENNPLRAKIVKKAENYDFSSARLHLLNDSASEIITKDIIQTKKKEYRDFFYDLEAIDKKHIAQVADVVQQEKVLGSEEFIKWVEGKFNACLRIRGRGRPAKKK
ncbi:MAG: transposase [Candidatus Omnitrophica bacterium]|nr:transposase [Candidatus Omnitrophota bacterium]